MSVKTKTSGKSLTHKQETQVTYEIGKSKVLITRVFREDNAQSLDRILLKLIKKEIEKP